MAYVITRLCIRAGDCVDVCPVACIVPAPRADAAWPYFYIDGVAMGITGTDVAKEAADMVLRDDNFATIVASVAEGRTIYDNLRKFIKFTIAGNIGKVAVMLLALFLGKPLPLLPLQLL